MCGIVGIISKTQVVPELVDSLIQLQHRGQDAAGISISDKKIVSHKGFGLVRDLSSKQNVESISDTMGVLTQTAPPRARRAINRGLAHFC